MSKDAETIRKEKRLTELAEKIYIALLANSERYKYISNLITREKITQGEATFKNIHKAYLLANDFINYNPFS